MAGPDRGHRQLVPSCSHTTPGRGSAQKPSAQVQVARRDLLGKGARGGLHHSDAHMSEATGRLGQHRLGDVVHAGRHAEAQLSPFAARQPACRLVEALPGVTAARAGPSSSRPAAAIRTLFRVRSNTSTPTSASKRLTCWLSAGWAMCRRRAALPKCSSPASTTRSAPTADRHSCPQLMTDANALFLHRAFLAYRRGHVATRDPAGRGARGRL